ncbi:ABC transporter permease [Maridesulfovibrio sp.]|uniref:ABC transporter permease n=1 Tax=Maridesulfovibrio sp. TaxID=2795000 RepID=UPI003BADAA6E
MNSIWRQTLKFVAAFIILLLVNFILPRLLPGDPLLVFYGEEAVTDFAPSAKEALIAKMHLNAPLMEQFTRYLVGIVRLDFGYSYHQGRQVLDLILDFAPWTMALTGLTLIFSTLLAVFVSLRGAWDEGGRFDRGTINFFMILNCIPPFILAMLLLRIFAITFNLFPLSGGGAIIPPLTVSGWLVDLAWHAALPVASLMLHEVPNQFLLLRAEALRWKGKPFVSVFLAKGYHPRTIKYKHLMLCITPAIFARVGKSVAALMGGAMFVEIVFTYPGLGLLVFESLQAHDYPTVQGVMLTIGSSTLLFNFMADLINDSLLHRISS